MAGFVKLHQTMLRSTTWKARPEREIFITALLMAEPRELRTETPQLKVDALEPTGWRIPPGWYGWCDTSGVGIIDEAGVEREAGVEALRRLGEPEPASRSQAFDGRRLVRVDGGYIVLNYDKYREKDTTCAERARRYRDRKSRDVTRSVTCQDRSVTQAEAEAEAEAEKRPDPKDLSGTPQPNSPRLDRPGQNSGTRLPPQNRTEKRPQTSQATTPATPHPETRPEAITEQELKRRCREEPTRDIHSRAAQCVANPYDGLFERPEMWPEVQAMAYAFSCVYGARYRHLGKIPQHKGLMTLLAILGAGVTHTDYMRAVNLSTEDDWFAKLKGPSLTTLSLDVVLRLLAEADERGAA